jgi:uroporphyrinogen-III decarboxylase
MQADRLADFDFARHNAEVKQLWEAYNAGKPPRIPIIIGLATRFFMMHPVANQRGWTFREFTENPDTMFEVKLAFERWHRFNILQDYELGLPEKWNLGVDFQNYYEAAWFGCPIEYLGDQVPDTRPAFADAPERVMERGLPEPFSGVMARVREYVEHFRARAKTETFLGRPIEVSAASGLGTDGVMTVACNLFGPDVTCEMMGGEPERLHRLFDFITEATIRRMKAFRELFKVPVPQDGFGFADDSIALISTTMYREHVLPYHRRLCNALATTKPRSTHLCGDATRHFKTLRDELNIQTFDTGFPVDFAWLRKELGPKVRINGGPHIEFLRTAKPAAVREEVRRILQSGILEGGLFTLREGNNLAPHTPLENTEALYHGGREFGRL